MNAAGAKSLARALHNEGANPPVYTKVGNNGPDHKHVVHVTFGQPKAEDKTDKQGQVIRTIVPERPRPYTVS